MNEYIKKYNLKFIANAQMKDLVDIILCKNFCENGVSQYRMFDLQQMDKWFKGNIQKDFKEFRDELGIDFFSLYDGEVHQIFSWEFSSTFTRYAMLDEDNSITEKSLEKDYLGYSYVSKNYKVVSYQTMATKEHMREVHDYCRKHNPEHCRNYTCQKEQAYGFMDFFLNQSDAYKGFCLLFSDPKYRLDKIYPELAEEMERQIGRKYVDTWRVD